jgi:hypothetical protein
VSSGYADAPRGATQSDAGQPGDREPDVYVALPASVALRLQAALPGLLRALADRETQTPAQRKRRREAYQLLELVRDALNDVLPASEAPSDVSPPQ